MTEEIFEQSSGASLKFHLIFPAHFPVFSVAIGDFFPEHLCETFTSVNSSIKKWIWCYWTWTSLWNSPNNWFLFVEFRMWAFTMKKSRQMKLWSDLEEKLTREVHSNFLFLSPWRRGRLLIPVDSFIDWEFCTSHSRRCVWWGQGGEELLIKYQCWSFGKPWASQCCTDNVNLW